MGGGKGGKTNWVVGLKAAVLASIFPIFSVRYNLQSDIIFDVIFTFEVVFIFEVFFIFEVVIIFEVVFILEVIFILMSSSY